MAKKFAMIFGWIFLIIGILGFISNPIVGNAAGVIFQADKAANIVHLLTGIIFLWVAYGMMEKAGMTLRVGAVVYLLIAIFGFFGSGTVLHLMEANMADNWLHLIIGLFLVWGGWSKSGGMAPAMGGQQM
jgi:hypothetical protein